MAITKGGPTSLFAGAFVLLFIASNLVPDHFFRARFEVVGKHDPFTDRPVAIPIPPAPTVTAAKIAIPFGSNSTLGLGNLFSPLGVHKRFTW